MSVTRRGVLAGAAVALLTGLITAGPAPRAAASPVATDDTLYQAFGRVFPDPHGCMPRQMPFSPWAKGNVCAADFIQFDEMVAGLRFLESKFGGFIDLIRLDERYSNPEFLSAGLATPDLQRDRAPLWMVRVTDERVPDDGKKHFVFPLSIHGIERAGVEGGVRAIEDLATWAAQDPGHKILESTPEQSIAAGDALRGSAVYFIFPNPDGWRRGDRNNGVFYQRYNGNGVDLNRDWPATGFTYEPYTPLSEPESRAFSQVLKGIRGKWDGGIDLHGQLIDRAFSFTLLGQGQHDYAKNQAMLDIVQGAWRDAEKRLSWSPLIKPNDASADDQRLYGVQWGTVWDTIGYTVTGALGDWINGPLGLDGVGIDNEMSLSHISNCGTGICFVPDVEQLHVDGNKSLIYSMINYTMRSEDKVFRFAGRVAYLDHGRVLRAGAVARPAPSGLASLPTDADINDVDLTPANDFTAEFEVRGPSKGVYDGGLNVTVRALNARAIATGARTNTVVERKAGDEWEIVNNYYNQDPLYLQAGQTVDVNEPEPGTWRVRVEGGRAGVAFRADIDFSRGPAWKHPGQLAYEATNLDFFRDLNRFVAGRPLEPVTADAILEGTAGLDRFDTLVIADDTLPGFAEPPRTGPAQANIVLEGADALKPAYPCAGEQATPPTPGCEAIYEWTVDPAKNSRTMTVSVSWNVEVFDWDLYVERFAENGDYWTPVARSAGSSMPEVASILKPLPGRYRARVVNFASAEPSPSKLEVTFSNQPAEPARTSSRSADELASFAAALREFVEAGGNLVLTDGALRLLAPMGIVPRTAVHEFAGFAGFIGFTADGVASTYDDPLGKDVQRPGAAEGPAHRHQTYDPGVIGFDIGGDTERHNTAPIWAVDQTLWGKAGGRTVGTSTGDQTTLGELKVGKGVVRIVGALLPMPTDAYFHPFGLASYAVTYSGYEVFRHAVDYRAARVLAARTERGGPTLPRSGMPAWFVMGAGLLLLAAAEGLRRWRAEGW